MTTQITRNTLRYNPRPLNRPAAPFTGGRGQEIYKRTARMIDIFIIVYADGFGIYHDLTTAPQKSFISVYWIRVKDRTIRLKLAA